MELTPFGTLAYQRCDCGCDGLRVVYTCADGRRVSYDPWRGWIAAMPMNPGDLIINVDGKTLADSIKRLAEEQAQDNTTHSQRQNRTEEAVRDLERRIQRLERLPGVSDALKRQDDEDKKPAEGQR